MHDHDLLRLIVDPVRVRLQDMVAALSVPPAAGLAIVALADTALLALLVVCLARVGAALGVGLAGSAGARGRRAARGAALTSGCALGATALLWWIVRFPSAQIHELFTRGDHLTFALLAGALLARLPLEARTWALSALSLAMLWQYSGLVAVAAVLGAGLAGFAALGPAPARRPWVAALLQGGIVGAFYAFCLALRPVNLLQALQVHGLSFFLLLRHVSFVVDVCRGAPASLGSYLCFMSFYPGASGPLGSPEVYQQFSRRNLTPRAVHDYPRAARCVVEGALQLWAADRVPVSLELLLGSSSTPALWLNSGLLFLQVALRGMGFWAMIEGTALFYGIRLQPNFKAILTRQNPSELWWAWRGSLTNWLVHYVYGPLGASRRHPSRNILAAFGVSMLWHWMAVPFLVPGFRWPNLVPITTWFVLNATGVVAHVAVRRRGWTVLPAGTPPAIRRGAKICCTMLLGTSCATLPNFQGALVARFPGFIRMTLGLGGW